MLTTFTTPRTHTNAPTYAHTHTVPPPFASGCSAVRPSAVIVCASTQSTCSVKLTKPPQGPYGEDVHACQPNPRSTPIQSTMLA